MSSALFGALRLVGCGRWCAPVKSQLAENDMFSVSFCSMVALAWLA